MAVLVFVVVVAVTIALVLFLTTCRPFRTRIKTLAFFAVVLLHRTTQTLGATVAAVEITFLVVVVVVAVAIALELCLTTCRRFRRF